MTFGGLAPYILLQPQTTVLMAFRPRYFSDWLPDVTARNPHFGGLHLTAMPLVPDLVYTPSPEVRASDEHLDHIAGILDDIFRIPGTSIRFGLDAIVGWIPGIGDAIAGIASFIIVFAAWQRGAPYITLARMILNVLLEMTLGAIPVVGDVFHVAWKCNRRNYRLLMRLKQNPRAHTWSDWLFVALIFAAVAAMAAAPLVLLVWLMHSFGSGLRSMG